MMPFYQLYSRPYFISLSDNAYSFIKRTLDIIISATAAVLCLPLTIPVIFVVLYQSPGKIIYKQKRYGLHGREFTIYKLRTMYSTLCDTGEIQAKNKEPRITRGGEFLRRYHIDELPQLYNVLMGDMSLVGPRPHAIPMDHYYSTYIPFYKDRYQVKPGITGLAQTKGSHGETKIIQDMEHRILLDLEYIHKKSLWLDLLILIQTTKTIMAFDHA